MSNKISKQQPQVNANYKYFQAILTDILRIHRGKYALLRNCKSLGYYDTPEDATEAARVFLPGKVYSIQEVASTVIDLGHFSHVDSLV